MSEVKLSVRYNVNPGLRTKVSFVAEHISDDSRIQAFGPSFAEALRNLERAILKDADAETY